MKIISLPFFIDLFVKKLTIARADHGTRGWVYTLKNFLKNFLKSVDRPIYLCYNNYRK